MRILFVILLFLGLSPLAPASGFDVFEKWKKYSSDWRSENQFAQEVNKIHRNQDKLKKALRGQTQDKSFLNSNDFNRLDPVRKIEWLVRMSDPSQFEVLPRDMKSISTRPLAERVLGIMVENSIVQVFSAKMDTQSFRNKMRTLVVSLPDNILTEIRTLSWWDWILQDEARAMTREFVGFSPDVDPRLEALVFYDKARRNSDFMERWNNFAWARYVLNSDPQTRSRGLAVFDAALLSTWLPKDLGNISKTQIQKFLDTGDPGLMNHRIHFLSSWEKIAFKEGKKSAEEILLDSRIVWSKRRGIRVALNEFLRLLELRVDLGMSEESFSVIEKIEDRISELAENESSGLLDDTGETWGLSQKINFEVLKARAALNLAKIQKEPRRGETLSWAQEYYRRALDFGALLSDRRDEILVAYSRLLESRGFWIEASESWHSLFLGGRESDFRKMGLFKAAQVLAWNLRRETPRQETQKILYRVASLSSFFVRAYPFTSEGRTLAATLRVESRKRGFSKDPIIQATLFEIESLSDPKFLKKQRNPKPK